MNRDDTSTKADRGLRGLPFWKKGLLFVAGLLVVSGLAIKGYSLVAGTSKSASKESGAPSGSDGSGNLVAPQKLLPGEGPTEPRERPSVEEPSTLDEWSPALVKGGLSLFVGFCVGYALRSFAKLAALVLGLVFIGILVLSWSGVVQVEWDKVSAGFDSLVAAVKTQFESFKVFLQGSLPSASLATVGLVSGLKKK